MSLADFNIYLGLGVNGFFTALGVVSANAFYDYLKHHFKRIKARRRSKNV